MLSVLYVSLISAIAGMIISGCSNGIVHNGNVQSDSATYFISESIATDLRSTKVK